MTDNINTADLVKRLRECSSDEAMWSRQAADRIEQLEAALTRANAATAAAYEAMASEFDSLGNVGLVVATGIRALATPDQTAALDKLIAEAEARGKTIGAATEKIRRLVEWLGEDDCNVFLLPHDDVVKMRAILAASKKGGV